MGDCVLKHAFSSGEKSYYEAESFQFVSEASGDDNTDL